jgi:hypothetical protein
MLNLELKMPYSIALKACQYINILLSAWNRLKLLQTKPINDHCAKNKV